MASTAYSRPSKPPGPAAGERKGPRLAKELGRIEPKKLGIGLVAGCCLALLTYLSFARLFAIYSPVFDSSSLLLKNTPPATTTVPATEALPVQQKTQVEDQKDAPDPELDPNMPNLPEVTQKDQQEEATATKPDRCCPNFLCRAPLLPAVASHSSRSAAAATAAEDRPHRRRHRAEEPSAFFSGAERPSSPYTAESTFSPPRRRELLLRRPYAARVSSPYTARASFFSLGRHRTKMISRPTLLHCDVFLETI